MTRGGVLFISYDGVLEPLGQSQVLAYLKPLAQDRLIHLISFEKAEDYADTAVLNRAKDEIAVAGILWHPLRYHKKPSALATSWDIACGIVVGVWLVVLHKLSIVHARSYVPSVIAIVIKRLTAVMFLFDMRGFWVDERVDGGLWPRDGHMFKIAKAFERRFLIDADHVVSLTQSAVNEMERFDYLFGRMPPITVIPTCADMVRFCPQPYSVTKENFTLGYVGSAGTWYLFDEVANCFAYLLQMQPKARFLILNKGQHEHIRNELSRAGVPDEAFDLIDAKNSVVTHYMNQMDAGIFFYRPSFSRAACAPTKLGEFLGCGIPCIGNVGVGDMAALLEGENVGVAVHSFDNASLANGLKKLLQLVVDPTTRDRCVEVAHRNFSLDKGVTRYRHIYEQLTR